MEIIHYREAERLSKCETHSSGGEATRPESKVDVADGDAGCSTLPVVEQPEVVSIEVSFMDSLLHCTFFIFSVNVFYLILLSALEHSSSGCTVQSHK